MIKKLLVLLFGVLVLAACKNGQTEAVPLDADTAIAVAFDADTAMLFIEQQCAFGARTPGSEAHRKCGEYIVEQFRRYGLEVTIQEAPLRMWDGKTFQCRNIIAQYRPDAAERIVVCTHYDSRPWCDQDSDESKHNEPVMAANDGASGVAVMIEIARKLQELPTQLGIDFVCFDLEDYGAPHGESGAPGDGSDWCVGSRYWASHPHRDGYAPQFGILLDMVGGRGARFAREAYSLQYASPVVARIWAAARTAGYKDFFLDTDGGAVTDDHLNLNVNGIPTADIIPYDTQHGGFGLTWHTSQDTPENIDRATLKAVGQTLLQLIADY